MAAPASQPHTSRTVQVAQPITSTTTRYVGKNYEVRAHVAEVTGDDVSGPFGTAGWCDTDLRTFMVVLHHSGHGGRAELSVVAGGLPLSRDILLALHELCFCHGAATEILIRCRVEHLAQRGALRRLGFVITGRERRPDGERLLMALRPSTIPIRYARALARRYQ